MNNTRAQPVKFVKHSPEANITAKPANKSHKYVHLSVIGNVMIDQLGNVYSAIVKNGKMKLHKIGQYKANNIKALPFKHMDKKGERQLVSVGKLVVDQHGSMYFDLSKNGKVSLHKIGQYKVLK